MLADLIGRRVKLKRSGDRWYGCCPFHNEKTPSFVVYSKPDPHFHCFGCGAHGRELDWLLKVEKLSYAEAQKKLGTHGTTHPARLPLSKKSGNDNIRWPEPGVEWQETAFLRERLVQSHWSDLAVRFQMTMAAPALDDRQLRLRHPYAQTWVLDRLREIYPRSK